MDTLPTQQMAVRDRVSQPRCVVLLLRRLVRDKCLKVLYFALLYLFNRQGKLGAHYRLFTLSLLFLFLVGKYIIADIFVCIVMSF